MMATAIETETETAMAVTSESGDLSFYETDQRVAKYMCKHYYWLHS